MDWKTVLERDGPAAWRAAYRIVGQAADADDCLQEAALAAVQLSRREPVGNWRALLTRLAAARAVDRLRQRYRNRISATLDEQSAAMSDSHEPVASAQLEELQSQLRVALAQLSQDQATAFCLCALEGWTHAEAGEQLQTPSSTIGVLVHRARQRLRELLPSIDPQLTPTRSHP
ncbi:MAG: sigma-70 family RNA polymerase sigma factor [Planctomycetaceae bacterium]|nr:sigma-70 family RNA polymerase sigma factor [Planctomycetaceae bacterium]